MAGVTKAVRRGGERTKDQVSDRAPDLEDESGQEESGQEEESGGREEKRADSGRSTVTSELKDTIREAAIEILRPVARQATKSAAKYAVTRGPDLVMNKVLPKVEEAGGAGALAKGALSKAKGSGGSEGGGVGAALSGLTERLGRGGDEDEGASPVPMQEHADIAADLQTVYDQFTQFEDFPEFAEQIDQVRQRDDTTLTVHESIRRGSRSWDVQIVEQVPCERIVFEGAGGSGSVGVVTFHRLSDHLTRVDVSVLFQPSGLLDKTAGVRAYRRALESALPRFKAWMELRDETTGSWRGRVEEGEVVDAEEGGEEEPEEQEQPRGEEEYEEEPEAEEAEEEPEAEAEPEAEEEDAEEEEERPRRRRSTRRRAADQPSQPRSGTGRASRARSSSSSGDTQSSRPRSGTGRASRARSSDGESSPRPRRSSRARS